MEETLLILLRLIFAHILSDFPLQTDRISKGKRGLNQQLQPISHAAKYSYLLKHSAIHATMAYLFAAQWNLWVIPLVIFMTHFLIDYAKSTYTKDHITSFLVDQLLHFSILILLWLCLYGDYNTTQVWIENTLQSPRIWMLLTAYLLLLKPTSIFIGLFIKRWTPSELSLESLPNAGKWIGYLERTLILTFILAGAMEGVGFLLAAKSIFRFGELNKAKEIRITEYVLIGTLMSFSIAIIVGLLLR